MNLNVVLNRRLFLFVSIVSLLGVGAGFIPTVVSAIRQVPAIASSTAALPQDEIQPGATRIVTKTADTNDGLCNSDCSLREAVAAAAGGDVIAFGPVFNTPQTITLSTVLIVDRSLGILGPGARLLTIRASSGQHIFRFTASASIGVEVKGVTLADANVVLQTDEGGAVQVLPLVTATFTDVTFRNNIGWGGAAIYSVGNLGNGMLICFQPSYFARCYLDIGRNRGVCEFNNH